MRDYALAPDGRALALLEASVPRPVPAGAASGTRSPAPRRLWLVDLATGAARERASLPPEEAPARPALSWSPTGRYLVLAAQNEAAGIAALRSCSGSACAQPC
jgi:hypothetical protein